MKNKFDNTAEKKKILSLNSEITQHNLVVKSWRMLKILSNLCVVYMNQEKTSTRRAVLQKHYAETLTVSLVLLWQNLQIFHQFLEFLPTPYYFSTFIHDGKWHKWSSEITAPLCKSAFLFSFLTFKTLQLLLPDLIYLPEYCTTYCAN